MFGFLMLDKNSLVGCLFYCFKYYIKNVPVNFLPIRCWYRHSSFPFTLVLNDKLAPKQLQQIRIFGSIS